MDTITISGFLRQNAWGVATDDLWRVETYKQVHCPWGHTQYDIDAYQSDPANYNKKYAGLFTKFKTGEVVAISQAKAKELLVVRLTSDTLCGSMPHLKIIRKARTCGHTVTNPRNNLEEGCCLCHDSVVKVVDPSRLTKDEVMDDWSKGLFLEDFVSMYRTVDLLGRILLLEDREDICSYSRYQASIKTTPITVPATYLEPTLLQRAADTTCLDALTDFFHIGC